MVGLTGGIGAGKSAVAARLAAHGAVIVDADRLARDVVEPGTAGFTDVVAAFGSRIIGGDGSLDRVVLGDLVFADPGARKVLEAIVHPLVRARGQQMAAAAPAGAIVVNDVPLLVEAGLGASYDLVVVVLASEEHRVCRLTRNRGMSESQALARIRAQASDDQRRAVADIVIDNDGTPDELNAQVDEVWAELRSRSEFLTR